MLNSFNRLSKNKDFDKVFQKGRSSYQEVLGAKLIPNNLDHNRFGVLVGLKINKKAVIRNKVKRQIKAVIRLEEPFLKKGYDCVIVVLPLILAKKYSDIKLNLKTSFKKLNFYQD
ncbi:ribonuclease P protein component [Candidatus Falkowbacteria bacterium CG10_big_fil_rev_8_21_14_0_10_39_9]|uniref:Ribonuclease P protein component n=1 Tax=Candidatus Falkowbacteria bacterium CG10_big_fil_rev_8_21_14_0_10_39_9 TaxID=1974566 RepID=A0A2M6WP22_9BACT|nr:MAG: ribonuclease P protein component [Candidatus Falkowbacteria bacterium CG10_big_fil_rev_8_21_14_0_10_39_9]